MTKDEAQRRRWTFYEAVKVERRKLYDSAVTSYHSMEIRPARMRFRKEIWERTHGWRSDVDVTVEQIARLLEVKDLEGLRKAVEVGKPDKTYGYLNDPRAFFQALLVAQG